MNKETYVYKEAFIALMERRDLYECDIDETLSNLRSLSMEDIEDEVIYSLDEKDFESFGFIRNDDENTIDRTDLFYELFYDGQKEAEDEIRDGYSFSRGCAELERDSRHW